MIDVASVLGTSWVVIVNVTTLVPPAIKTVAGIDIYGLAAACGSFVSVIVSPLGGATSLSVTVPFKEFPPTSVVGERVNVTTRDLYATTLKFLVSPCGPVAVTVAGVSTVTGLVNKPPAPVFDPAGTVSVPLLMAALAELIVIRYPPEGAGPSRVTFVPTMSPPVNPAGVTEKAVSRGAFTSKDWKLSAPLAALTPRILTVVSTPTGDVLTVKGA